MTSANHKRAILYPRLSKGDEALEHGAGRQLELLRKLADSLGYVVVAVLGLEDRSASQYASRLRKQYRQAMRMVDAGQADAILFYDVDRLLRIPRELEDLIDRVERSNGALELRSINGELNLSSGDGKFIARILVAKAAKEADDISRRVKLQRESLRSKLVPMPSGSVYGWVDNATQDPDEAAHVAHMVERVLVGESLESIARDLNKAGVARKMSSRPWDGSVVGSIVTTPRNYGLVATSPRTRNKGTVAERSDVQVAPGNFEGIRPAEEYGRVVAALEARAPRGYRPRRAGMLAELLHCSACGTPLTSDGRRRFVCVKRKSHPDACSAGGIDRELVERELVRVVWKAVDDLELAELVSPHSSHLDVGALRDRLAVIDSQVGEVTTEWRKGELPMSAYKEAIRQLEDERAELDRALVNASNVTVLNPYAGRPGALRAAWDSLKTEVRRQIIVDTLQLRHERIMVDPPERRFNPAQPSNPEWIRKEWARVHFDEPVQAEQVA